MANLLSALSEKMARVARKEIKSQTTSTKRAAVRYRHDIADLKRQVAKLVKRLAQVEKHQPKALTAPPELVETARFRADSVRSHRAKLGLSAAKYAQLVGVSDLSIYKWEAGKSRPRKAQLAKFLAVRGLGKREVLQRLGMAEPNAAGADKAAAKPRNKRGTFAQTAAEFILSLVKSRKATTTGQINAAWKKARRGGNADNTLYLLVGAKTLKRVKLKGERGSRYSIA